MSNKKALATANPIATKQATDGVAIGGVTIGSATIDTRWTPVDLLGEALHFCT